VRPAGEGAPFAPGGRLASFAEHGLVARGALVGRDYPETGLALVAHVADLMIGSCTSHHGTTSSGTQPELSKIIPAAGLPLAKARFAGPSATPEPGLLSGGLEETCHARKRRTFAEVPRVGRGTGLCGPGP